ncbi:MAG: CPBP family intramembrane metalloprotease [Bryobacteraceae bacterium]|nr:CPBP family intramembrane metalloprotease [Bryobacteraceae bacterium]MDW8379697.1 type II CAAX endopeptidase family protein [Bryobacterales bacterium]
MRLNSSDWRLLAISLLILLGTALYVSWNWEVAFPQASLELKLTRDQITERAARFVSERGIQIRGFRQFTTFEPDEEGRLYLERELGLGHANQLMQSEVPIWKWRARWYKPPEKEEVLVYLKPDGKLAGFEHRIEETNPGPRLDKTSARLLAESFLKSQSNKPHRLVAEQTEKRPNRDDHVFTWEQEGFKAKQATIRRSVVIYGDRVGSYQEFLYIPEQWKRDFAKLRSSNELFAGIASGCFILLAIAALFAFGSALRRREIVWRPLLWIAATVAFLNLLNDLNSVPFTVDSMPSSSPYEQSLLLAILQAIGSASGVYLYVLGPLAAGVALYHRRYPNFLRLPVAFTPSGIGSRSFFRATVAGFGMAGAHLAFVTAFYLIGAKFGVWSPQDVSYSDMLATPFPWLYPVAIAMMASSAEEFWFRLLAIPLLAQFVKSRWVAIILPAFVWGFLHATYPQQPGYIRGLEVGIIGIAAGWLMERFGIVATLVWHYVIDAFLIGLFLFRGGNWLYWFHGAMTLLFILAPLLAVVVAYRKNKGFLPEPETAPCPQQEEAPVQAEPLEPPVEPLLPATYLYVAGAVCAVLLLFGRPFSFGEFLSVRLDRQQAEDAAKRFLAQKGVPIERWHIVSDFTPNLRPAEVEYLRQQLGAAKANEAVEKYLYTGVWRVRFFQPQNPEEWFVYFNRDGKLYRYDHVLDEKAPGAKLTPEEARKKAEEFLGGAPGEIAESQQDKRDQRTDHSFEWEHPVKVGEARLRTAVTVVGDEVCENRRYFKLPEQWLRDYEKPRLTSYFFPAFLGAIAVPLVIALVRQLSRSSHRFHWGVYAKLAALATVVSLLDLWNSQPAWMRSYVTSTPIENFYGQLAVSLGSSSLFTVVGLTLAAVAADAFLQLATGARRLPPPSFPRAVGAAMILGAAVTLPSKIRDYMPGPRLDLKLWEIPGIDTAMPSVDILLNSILISLAAVCLGAILILGSLAMLSKRGLKVLVILLVALQVAQQSLTLGQMPYTLAGALTGIGLLVLLVTTCATDLLSLALGIFWMSTLPKAYRLYEQTSPTLRREGLLLFLLVTVVSIAVFTYGRKTLGTSKTTGTPASSE